MDAKRGRRWPKGASECRVAVGQDIKKTPKKRAMDKKEKTIIGHIGVIGPRKITRRKKCSVLSIEDKERLIAQAKSAYEIRID